MTTEQKAKAYDEAFEIAKKNYVDAQKLREDSQIGVECFKKILESIFHKLQEESEYEKIRNALIRFHKSTIDVDGIKGEDIIAWLEKQEMSYTKKDVDDAYLKGIGDTKNELEKQGGITKLSEEEQNRFAKGVLTRCALSFIDYLDAHKYEGKMCVSNGECEDIENAFHNAMWDRLHRYYCKYIEKQGEQILANSAKTCKDEQKPIDKVESKFCKGDWIISNDKKSIYQVIEVKRGIYVIRDNADNHEYHIGIEECEKSGRPFTIHYAKDGDVLASGQDIFIFKEIRGAWIYCYCLGDNDGAFMANSYDLMRYNYYDVIHPATKEQRDILYKAMADAGYAFDFNKKELKKIVQKHAEWSEEDERAIGIIKIALEHPYDMEGKWDRKFALDWLKSLKDRVGCEANCTTIWKPSEEQMEALDDFIYAKYPNIEKHGKAVKSLYQDLKKL